MNIKQKVVGILMIFFLVGGLAALPAQAGVMEGNSGKGGQPVDVKKFVKPGQTTIIDFYSHCLRPLYEAGPHARRHGGQTPQDASG